MATEEDTQQNEEHSAHEVHIDTDSLSLAECPDCGCEIDVEGIPSFELVKCPDCQKEIPVPAKLGPFILTKMLGAGGMGAVYVAKDEALGRQVAVKVMLKSLGDDPAFIESFKREAQAAAKINHPNICQIYSFGTEKGQPYIIMEYISGERFDAMVEGTPNLDQGLVMQVGHDIAQGLAAAYEEGLLHGDIKPENILLDEKLKAKLVDFGIASVAGQASEGVWGTPYYIAPEKILRQKPDGRSDIYSLGATLYHALAGRPPFEGKSPIEVVKARLDKDPPPLTNYRKDLKPEVIKVVQRMLQRTPGMRHPTYASLISDLANCVKACGGRRNSLSKLKKSGRIILSKKTGLTPVEASEPAPAARQVPRIKPPKKTLTFSSSSSSASLSRPAGTPRNLQSSAPKKPASKAPLVVFLILALLAGLGGGAYYLWTKKQDNIAARRENIAFNNAVSDIGKEILSISNAVNSITRLVNNTADFPSTASNSVKIVTGQDLNLTQAAAPAVTEPKTGDDPPKAGEDPPKAEPEKTGSPDLTTLAKRVIDNCRIIRDRQTDAEAKRDEALKAMQEGRSSGNSITANEKLVLIKTISGDLDLIQKDARAFVEATSRDIAEIETARISFQRAEDAKRLSAEAAERARIEAAETERIERERLQLIATEKSLVAVAQKQATELYKANNYADGLNIIQIQAKSITTEEAKTLISNLVEQGQLLVEMKQFLAKQMTEDPYPWGWIQDGRAVDIVKATTETITTRTREPGWAEVSGAQMLHIFKKYMNKHTVPLKDLARQNLAAAIYCHINGGGSVQGDKLARDFADKAIGHDPNIDRLAKKVLPSLYQ